MKPETSRVAKAVGAAIAGAAVGYVAGTLTAPAAGSETRRKIGHKIEEEAEDMKNKASRTLQTAKEKMAEALHL